MASSVEKKIQELEIRVSVTGDKHAEEKLNRLVNKQRKIEEREERSTKRRVDREKIANEEIFRDKVSSVKKWKRYKYRQTKKDEIQNVNQIRKTLRRRNRILGSVEKNRLVSLSRKNAIEKNKQLDIEIKKRKELATLQRKNANAIINGDRKRAISKGLQGNNVRNRYASLDRSVKLIEDRKNREYKQSVIKDRVMSNIYANKNYKEPMFDRPVTEQNSILKGNSKLKNNSIKKTNKLLMARIKIEKALSSVLGKNNRKEQKEIHEAGRRSGGGIVGKSMLYLGAGTMVGYMSSSLGQSVMGLGDVASNVENDVLKGQSFRSRYSQTGNIKDFDEATKLYSQLSGQAEYLARSQMAEVAGSLDASGVHLKGKQLTGIARAMRGLSGGMGITEDMASQKILGLLSGRISAEEAGLVGVKRSSDPSKTLDSILDFLEKNSVTNAVMKGDTISSFMANIRSAPKGLMADLYGNSPNQMKSGIRTFSQWIDSFFGKGNSSVKNAWGTVMANFDDTISSVFGGDASNFSKTIVDTLNASLKVGKYTGKGIEWGFSNPKKLIEGLLGYKYLRALGIPKIHKIPTTLINKLIQSLADLTKVTAKLSGWLIKQAGKGLVNGSKGIFHIVKDIGKNTGKKIFDKGKMVFDYTGEKIGDFSNFAYRRSLKYGKQGIDSTLSYGRRNFGKGFDYMSDYSTRIAYYAEKYGSGAMKGMGKYGIGDMGKVLGKGMGMLGKGAEGLIRESMGLPLLFITHSKKVDDQSFESLMKDSKTPFDYGQYKTDDLNFDDVNTSSKSQSKNGITYNITNAYIDKDNEMYEIDNMMNNGGVLA